MITIPLAVCVLVVIGSAAKWAYILGLAFTLLGVAKVTIL